MISTVEVIEESKAISDIGLEIQTLNNAYANHAKAMSETMEKIKELTLFYLIKSVSES